LVKREYYYPYGGNRGATFSDWTTKRFTGQYHESGLPGGEGLSYYNARWYDAQLGRFVSADTVAPDPGDPQALDRLAYVRNNPLRFVDPTGHVIFEDDPGTPTIDRRLNYTQLAARVLRYRRSWGILSDVPQVYRNTLIYNSVTPGDYADWGGNAKVQTGWRDPATLISSLFAGGRLITLAAPRLITAITASACADGNCVNEISFVRSTLPKLRGSFAEAFEGTPVIKTLKPGTLLYRSEALEAKGPGPWFGTQLTQSAARADRWWNIGIWGNPMEVVRTYRVVQEVTVYYGRVAGGRGTQILFPRDIPLDKVVIPIAETLLK